MSCLEFRREKLADLRRLSPEARAHAKSCPPCAAFAREVDQTERALDRALATPVPEGLADRIIFQSRKPRPAWRAWALAAGVVLAIALGSSLVGYSRKAPNLYARLAIEHVVMEPESLTTVRNADPEAFRAVVQNFGGTLKALPGRIRYIRLCPVEEGSGWHVVFDTPEGLATLILVPGKRLDGSETASSSGWNALVRPARNGYYAIITTSAKSTSRVDRILRERVDWNV